jgi:hypothetical protein
VLRAWHRLGKRYRRLGLAREPHEAAGSWAERVSKERPDLTAELKKLSDRFENWRYAECLSGRRGTRESHDLIRALRAHRPRPHGERR